MAAATTSTKPLRPPPQRLFSKIPVQVDYSGGKGTITHDELVKVGQDILKKARRTGLDPEKEADHPKLDELYKKLWGDFKEFAEEFPIIFRWIVHRHKFSERPFRIYLQKHHKPSGTMWKDRAEMLQEQGEYLVFLWREENRDASAKHLEGYRRHIREHLKDEQERFDKAAKEAEETCKKNTEERTARLRGQLLEIAQRSQLKTAAGSDSCSRDSDRDFVTVTVTVTAADTGAGAPAAAT
jgi:DNA-binding ferritin-like protein